MNADCVDTHNVVHASNMQAFLFVTLAALDAQRRIQSQASCQATDINLPDYRQV